MVVANASRSIKQISELLRKTGTEADPAQIAAENVIGRKVLEARGTSTPEEFLTILGLNSIRSDIIAEIESGTTIPSLTFLRRISETLDMEFDRFFIQESSDTVKENSQFIGVLNFQMFDYDMDSKQQEYAINIIFGMKQRPMQFSRAEVELNLEVGRPEVSYAGIQVASSVQDVKRARPDSGSMQLNLELDLEEPERLLVNPIERSKRLEVVTRDEKPESQEVEVKDTRAATTRPGRRVPSRSYNMSDIADFVFKTHGIRINARTEGGFELGVRIKTAYEGRKIGGTDFAISLEIGTAHLYMITSGQRPPSLDLFKRIVATLNLTMPQFFEIPIGTSEVKAKAPLATHPSDTGESVGVNKPGLRKAIPKPSNAAPVIKSKEEEREVVIDPRDIHEMPSNTVIEERLLELSYKYPNANPAVLSFMAHHGIEERADSQARTSEIADRMQATFPGINPQVIRDTILHNPITYADELKSHRSRHLGKGSNLERLKG